MHVEKGHSPHLCGKCVFVMNLTQVLGKSIKYTLISNQNEHLQR